MRALSVAVMMSMGATATFAAEVTIVPGDTLYMNSTNPSRHYSDLVIHNIIVGTGPGEVLTITAVTIDLLRGGHIGFVRFPSLCLKRGLSPKSDHQQIIILFSFFLLIIFRDFLRRFHCFDFWNSTFYIDFGN